MGEEERTGINRRLLLKLTGLAAAVTTVFRPSGDAVWAKDHRRANASPAPGPAAKPLEVKLSPQARRAIHFAQEAAAVLGTNYVDTEHLLLALLRIPEGNGIQVLQRLGITARSVRQELLRQIVAGEGTDGQDIMLAPRSRRIIDLAVEEAKQLHSDLVGTDHLLLGLTKEHEGLAAQVLVRSGATLERTRQETRILGRTES